MGSSISRRLRRESLEDIAVRKARWKLRFYCWGWSVVLVAVTAQAIEVVLALLEHRAPQIDIRLPSAP